VSRISNVLTLVLSPAEVKNHLQLFCITLIKSDDTGNDFVSRTRGIEAKGVENSHGLETVNGGAGVSHWLTGAE
jgi:hypothetical protein